MWRFISVISPLTHSRRHFQYIHWECRLEWVKLDGTGFTNWCSRMHANEPGLINLGNSRILGFLINACFYLKKSFVRIFSQQLRKHIESWSKLRIYALVKKYFCVEPYILHIRVNHLITAMARYRMYSHDLNIERGRYNNPISLQLIREYVWI